MTGDLHTSGTLNGEASTLNVGGRFANDGSFNAGTSTLNLKNTFTNNGGFNGATGMVNFIGVGAQTIDGSAPASFGSLTINNASGVSATTAMTVTGLLNVSNGTFTSDDPETPSYSFVVQGEGMRAEGANLTFSSTQFRGLTRDRVVTMTVVLQNQGPGDAGGTRLRIPRPLKGVVSITWRCQATGGAVCPATNGSFAVAARPKAATGLDESLAVFPLGGTFVYTIVMHLTEILTSVSTQVLLETPAGVTNLNPTNSFSIGSYAQLLPMVYR